MPNWLELAREARKAANMSVQEGYHRAAASRAYYAAYSRVSHALAMAGLTMPVQREGPSHKRLRPLIETSMPDMDQPSRVALSRLVGRLYTLRIDADYKPSVLVGGKESREAASIMKTIFEAF
ncbi:MAG: HEPN domain-containing protein [Phycisphaeraceae bacterium]